MHIVVPDDAKLLILESLKTLHPDFKDRFGSDPSGLNTLMAHGQLARDPEILESLLQVLHCPYRGFRMQALQVLAGLKHPETADHLAYNSIRIHPLLHQDQATISGWSDLQALWNSDLLGESQWTLFCDDLMGESKTFHADLLGKIDAPEVDSRLRMALCTEDKRRLFAAYSLAMRKDPEARDILKDALDERRLAPMCIRGLCMSLDESAVKQIEPYTDPARGYFKVGDPKMDVHLDSHLAKLAREAIEFLSANSRDQRLALFTRTYLKNADDLRSEGLDLTDNLQKMHAKHTQHRPSRIAEKMHAARLDRMAKIDPKADFQLLTLGKMFAYDVVPSAADFIDRFLDREQQEALVEMQTSGVGKLLSSIDKNPEDLGMIGDKRGWSSIAWRGLAPTSEDFADLGGSAYYIRGFEFRYEREDLVAASVDWIRNPGKHYMGISLYNYLFSEIPR